MDPGEARRRTRNSATVAGGIFLSRISGLVRERFFAHFFGASLYADAWRAALRMPNVLQNLLGEGTLSASFIPIYAGMEEERRRDAARAFAGAAFGLLFVTAGLLALIGVAIAPWLVGLLFWGFDPERQALTVRLVRILFPMTAVLVLSAWALGILNSHRRFFLPYVAPVAWNLAMIAALALGGWLHGMDPEGLVLLLAWGALAGGTLQLLVQLPSALRTLGGFRPSLSTRVEGVSEAIRNFLPVVAARGAVNLSGWLDYALAAFLATGAVASLGYAQTLYILPISLFGLSVAASELPELSRGRGKSPVDVLAGEVGRGMERVAFFLLPSTLAYLLLGDVVVAALYETGAFGRPEVLLTWAVLAAYALGMWASATSRLLSSAFYALKDTRTPARIAYVRVALSLGVGAALMLPFDRLTVGDGLRLGAAGLALGASVGAWVELGLLRRALGTALGRHGIARATLLRLAGAAVGAAAIGLGLRFLLPEMHPIALAVLVLGPFGAAYVGAARVLGVASPLEALLPAPGAGPPEDPGTGGGG